MKKRTLVLVLAVVMLLGAAIGGTYAWLNAKTQKIDNVFVVGEGIAITLTETTTEYVVEPGATIAKDPVVTVQSNGGGCWLFVKVESTLPDFVKYSIEKTWTAVPGYEGVYYIEDAAETAYPVLQDNQVTVDSDVSDVSAAAQATLSFTAYAIQDDAGATAAEAWAAMLVELA